MRKVAIALVIVVVAAVLSTPLVGGILARKAHGVLVENLDQIEASTRGTIRVTYDSEIQGIRTTLVPSESSNATNF